jgi:hypothetical protein
MLFQRRAGPFPYASHFSLASKPVAVRRDSHGMPIREAHIGAFEVGEELLRALPI